MIITISKQDRKRIGDNLFDYLTSQGYTWEKLFGFQRFTNGDLVYRLIP